MVESPIFKRHPVATTLYVIYLLGWVWMAYIAYHDFTGYGNGETIGMCLFGFGILFILPFFTGALILAATSKKASDFYFRLVLLILAPIPLAVIGAMIFHTSLS